MPCLGCLDQTKQTFESFHTDNYDTHWFIIDNSKNDEIQKWIESLNELDAARITYLKQDTNIGVAASWNLGILKSLEAGYDPVFVINNDLVFAPDTFDNLMRWYGYEERGYYEFITVVNIGSNPEDLITYKRKEEVSSNPNFIGFLINSRTVKRVGLFDEGYELGYFEDNDMHEKLKEEKIKAVCAYDAPVAHYGSAARKMGQIEQKELDKQFVKNRVRFKEKWGWFPELKPVIETTHTTKPNMARLLIVADAIAPTGFAKVNHNLINYLKHFWDIHVLGLNYRGDPHNYPYPIYPSNISGQGGRYGEFRLPELMHKLKPDIVLMINDPWVITKYLSAVKAAIDAEQLNKEQTNKIPLVAYIPIDSENVSRAYMLNGLDAAIFYTKFGSVEAVKGGFKKPSFIVPHGIDLKFYKQMDTQEARERLGVAKAMPKDAFVFGNVNRNQPRKRQDLTMMYFKRWIEEYKPNRPVFLYFHCAIDDIGYDLEQMSAYFGLDKYVLVPDRSLTVWTGIKEQFMHLIYNSLDIQLSTTLGEGWGLTVMESMACGKSNIVPDWSALGEWAKDAARLVPCTSLCVAPGNINTVGGVADEEAFVKEMQLMYENKELREEYSNRGLELVRKEEYRWSNIAANFNTILQQVMAAKFENLQEEGENNDRA